MKKKKSSKRKGKDLEKGKKHALKKGNRVEKKELAKDKEGNKKLVRKKDDVDKKVLKKKDEKKEGLKERYSVEVDGAVVDVHLEKQKGGYIYKLLMPEVGPATKALLAEVRQQLLSMSSFDPGEILDKKSLEETKKRFMINAGKILKEKIPSISFDRMKFLVGYLMQEMLGLGDIEYLIKDPSLEEIVIINSKEPVRVFHKELGWLATNIFVKSEEKIVNYANIISRRAGRQVSVLNPLLDAHVVTGDRANAVLYPISTKGNSITIRKFARNPWTIVGLIKNGTINKEMASILWLAVEYEMNVLVSGGTASGKTVLLNTLMPFIPPYHRIISIEDTREIMLPEFLYWCPLVTRSANPEGKGEVSMLDLLVNALRMRPDRIVLGEVRRGREAEVMFEAMHTGHSVYATVHADTSNETIRRLVNPPLNVPAPMLESVHLNVVMFRDRRKGGRKAFQLAEFVPSNEGVVSNILYRWAPEKGDFVQHNKSMVFFDKIGRTTGMSQRELDENLRYKQSILDWLVKNDVSDLNSFGKVMNMYYTDREGLDKVIKHNLVKEVLVVKKETSEDAFKEIFKKLEEKKTKNKVLQLKKKQKKVKKNEI